MSTTVEGEAEGSRVLRQTVDFVSKVLIPAGVLTGLLYYFGFVQARAFFAYFGIDLGTLELTSASYTAGSAGAIFRPLVSLFLIGVVAFVAHLALAGALAGKRAGWRRPIWVSVAAVAVALLALGAAGVRWPGFLMSASMAATALGLGALALDYATGMATQDNRLPPAIVDAVRRTRWQRKTLLVGLALVAAFWWTTNAANRTGFESARAVEKSLLLRPQAVVYSAERLEISGLWIVEEPLDGSDSMFAYRYTGLRVLTHTNGRWFLLPAGWTRSNRDVVVLLPDDAEGLRVDLRP